MLKLLLIIVIALPVRASDFDPGLLAKQAASLEAENKLTEALEVRIKAWYVSYPTQTVYDSLHSIFQRVLGMYMEQQDLARASQVLTRAEAFFPNVWQFARFRLYIAFSAQQFDQVVFIAEELLRHYGNEQPKADEIHFYAGHALQKLKAYSLALEHLQLVSKGFSDYRSVLVLLGDCEYHRGNLTKASDYLTQAQTILASDDVQAMLAKISRETPLDQGLESSAPTPHFIVRAPKAELSNATNLMAPMLEAVFTEFGQTLQFFPETPIIVIVYAGHDTMSARLGNPNWVAGVYDGEIRIPSSELQKNPAQLEVILRHEVMHLFLDSFTRNRIPTWLNEGLAQYYEQPFNFEDGGFTRREDAPVAPILKDAVIEALRQNRILSVSDLASQFVRMNQNQAKLAYAQSLMMAKFLVEGFGIWKVRRMLQEIYEGNRYEVALKRVFGLSPEELLNSWSSYQRNAWKLP